MSLKFPASEKLKSSKQIEELIAHGKTIKQYPLKLVALEKPGFSCTKAAFAVPKRNFKLAVDRNQLKRLLREAYRLEKVDSKLNNGKKFALLWIYLGKEKYPFAKLRKDVASLLNKI